MSHLWQIFTDAAKHGRSLSLPMQEGQPEFTLAEILERAERSAADVVERIGPPRRLGVLMNNGEPWVRSALMAFRLDAAVVPLPLPVGFVGADAYTAHLRRIADSAELDAILVDDSLGPAIARRVASSLPDTAFLDMTEPGSGQPAGQAAGRAPEPPALAEADSTLAVIQYTSGSTSAPKGVTLTHANVAAGLAAVTGGLGFTDEDCFGVWIPMFHDMGLFTVLSSLARGNSVCLWRPRDFVRRPMVWLDSFAKSTATVMAAPNFCYDLLVAAVRQDPPAELDLSKWRVACNGAEPVQRRTLEAFQEAFAPYGFRAATMEPVYGMAEATLIVSAAELSGRWRALSVDRDRLQVGDEVRPLPDGADGARPVVSCGRAAPGLSLRISEPGRVGEVQLSGPAVTGGYLNLPAEQQPFTADGWLRTGDLGFLHDDELYLVGRVKDMITVRGQNFYAEDVEEIVRTTLAAERSGGGVLRSAAIPWTAGDSGDAGDADGGEVERMVVLWETAPGDQEAAGLSRLAADQVRQQLGLDEVSVVPVPTAAIPHTTSGKVQRHGALGLYRSLADDATKG
ncbi:fatty-acyl-CoA synthase [Catenulispora sp. GP43]|uniref:AMP-binding protein n=1 Tax=Catenulispora sp. GP43 TaxID=3156263 RepID=UPI003511C9D1